MVYFNPLITVIIFDVKVVPVLLGDSPDQLCVTPWQNAIIPWKSPCALVCKDVPGSPGTFPAPDLDKN